jgi:long-chain fatty acid transport protein
VGNSSKEHGGGNAGIPNSLGPKDGRGFGWSNVNVIKLGIEHQYNDKLTLRAGFGKGDNPVQSRDVTFNILAPGVVQKHYTAGLSQTVGKSSEVTVSYMHAARNAVTGASLYNDFGMAAGTETIQMYQNSLGVAWASKW